MSDIEPKKGMRIRLLDMGMDPNTKEFDPNPIKSKEEGEIDSIDSTGTIFVNWDNGRYFGVLPGIDDYILLPSTSDQIGLDIFETDVKPVLTGTKSTPAGKNFNTKFSKPSKKLGVKIESEEEEIDETMSAGGGGGLAGASGYAFTPSLSYQPNKAKKSESRIIKVKDLMKEETTTSAISATVDFLVNNLMGWGTIKDMSPPWPSPTKKAENGELEDWWWQKIPTYNGGVITDPYAHTDDVWNDDILDANVNNDMTQFQKQVYKNPKKYKQSVITTDKGFDLNIDPPNEDWKISLQKGIKLKTQSNDPIETFRNRSYSRTIKKEEISQFTDDLITEAKKKKKDKRVHTKKWDRCVKRVEEKNKENNTDYNPYAVCQSSIGYEGSILKQHRKKEDIEEETTFASVFPGGNFPVGASFAAKKGQHIPSKKPIWKGGKIIQKVDGGVLNESEKDLFTEINKVKWTKGAKYVKIKDRCAKYNNQPWCSQGAIDNPLELSDKTFDIVSEISKKLGISEDVILERIKLKFKDNK